MHDAMGTRERHLEEKKTRPKVPKGAPPTGRPRACYFLSLDLLTAFAGCTVIAVATMFLPSIV